MYAGWGEVCKSLVVLLLAGEERFERSSIVVLEKSVALYLHYCVRINDTHTHTHTHTHAHYRYA